MDSQIDQPHWRGINHLALVTDDMDATVRFYHGVLGARLVATIGTPDFRHYFFEIGDANTVAFFEYAGKAHATRISATNRCSPMPTPCPRYESSWNPASSRAHRRPN